MNRILTTAITVTALFATYGWLITGGVTALIPGLAGVLSGVILTVLYYRTSSRSTLVGFGIVIGIVIMFFVIDDAITMFFGAVTMVTIVVTDLTLWLWWKATDTVESRMKSMD